MKPTNSTMQSSRMNSKRRAPTVTVSITNIHSEGICISHLASTL